MVPFAYSQATSVAAAVASGARHGSEAAGAGTDFIAGGTCMIQLMQERVRTPRPVVDILATRTGWAVSRPSPCLMSTPALRRFAAAMTSWASMAFACTAPSGARALFGCLDRSG